MKNPIITDVFEFDSCNPSYDAVQDKMCELQLKGWTHLRYEKGHHYHGGRDPYDTEHKIRARIEGHRPATPEDAKRIIAKTKREIAVKSKQIKTIREEMKKEIKEDLKLIQDFEEEIKEDEKVIATLSGVMSDSKRGKVRA